MSRQFDESIFIKAYIGEESRWIINEYFKGFEKETYPTADKDLCGFKEFYKTWEYYLDNKIADFYEEKSGIRIPIKKPDRWVLVIKEEVSALTRSPAL